MRFRFIGKYTNGHTSVRVCGVMFEGHEPATVENDAVIARLKRHIEIEVVAIAPAEPISQPKRRGRPKKVAD